MGKEADSPAHLFRTFGRAWARKKSDKDKIADLHAAAEAFRILLEGEKGLVHHVDVMLDYIAKEVQSLDELDRIEVADKSHHWVNQERMSLAWQHALERAIGQAVQGRVYVAGWRDHFAKIVPEMAERFPHAHDLEHFFEELELALVHRRTETGKRPMPDLANGHEQLAEVHRLFQDILDRLHTLEHDLSALMHDRRNEALHSLVYEELKKLAPLLYVTKDSVSQYS